MKPSTRSFSLLAAVTAALALLSFNHLEAQPSGYPVYFTQNTAWLVVGTGTETWTSQVPGTRQVSVNVNGFDLPSSPVQEISFTPNYSGIASLNYYLFASGGGLDGLGSAYVTILTNVNLTAQDQLVTIDAGLVENSSITLNGETNFTATSGKTYYLYTRVSYLTAGTLGYGISSASVTYPALVNVTNTATRTTIDAGNGALNFGKGQVDLGGFSATPQPVSGGVMAGVSYTLSGNNSNVLLAFSDTGNSTTENPNARVYAVVANEPKILIQPVSITVTQGLSAIFSISASGSAPLTYQWYFNSTPISQAQGINYTIPKANFANSGEYSVVISNSVGAILSTPAFLTVTAPPGYNQVSVQLLDTGQVQLTYLGIAGTSYALDRSFNLSPANWILMLTNTADGGGKVVFNCEPDPSTNNFWRLRSLPSAPTGMSLIPEGSFTIGNQLLLGSVITNDPDITDAIPTNVYVAAFYMDTNLVSYGQYQSIYNWATNQGYILTNAGSKGFHYPVWNVAWYDCVKWCNARSQQAGLTPVYYTDAGFMQLYTNGNIDSVYPNWSANGYRLPTEAEWEKAARGGLIGQRFPWGNTISESQANYYATPNPPYSYGDAYDLGPYAGFNTNYNGASPMGSFAPNGYGLNDMAGNLYEWCWDEIAGPPYPTGSPYLGGNNPSGPVVPPDNARVFRGGVYSNGASYARCAERIGARSSTANVYIGFRCVTRQ